MKEACHTTEGMELTTIHDGLGDDDDNVLAIEVSTPITSTKDTTETCNMVSWWSLRLPKQEEVKDNILDLTLDDMIRLHLRKVLLLQPNIKIPLVHDIHMVGNEFENILQALDGI